MPNGSEPFVRVPTMVLVAAFIAAILGVLGYAYAEDKENDEKIAELKECAVLTNQSLEILAKQLEQLNVNLEQKKQQEKQDATNAMLKELLKAQGKDAEKVVNDAKAAKAAKKKETP